MIRKANREERCHRSFTLRARCLVLTAVVSLVLSASASNATDCPTSADEISTDRPDFTSPPLAVPTGSIQFENGVLRGDSMADEKSDANQSPMLNSLHQGNTGNFNDFGRLEAELWPKKTRLPASLAALISQFVASPRVAAARRGRSTLRSVRSLRQGHTSLEASRSATQVSRAPGTLPLST